MRIETILYTDTEQKVIVGFDDELKDTIRMTTTEVDSNHIFLTYLTKDEALQLASLLTHYAKQ